MRFIQLIIIVLFTINFKIFCIAPFSFIENSNQLTSISIIDSIITQVPDLGYITNYIDSLEALEIIHPEFYGKDLNYSLRLDEIGTWDTLSNGDRVWRLKIVCPNALSTNIRFENFYIGHNSHISFYNVKKSFLLGPYDNTINRTDSTFSSHLIEGENLIIELFEPLIDNEINKLMLTTIVYGFNNNVNKVFPKLSNVQSAYCNINANCPEGDEYCREKYSISRLLVPWEGELTAFCSGSLLNNTNYDYKPYLLTGFHCLDLNYDTDLSETELNRLNSWSIQFGYIEINCYSGGGALYTFEYQGADFRSGWNTYKTDFLLVELQQKPKSGEDNFLDVFFNGWDRTGNIPNNVGGLHHPDGDYMKVSLDSDQPSTYLFYRWSVDGWDDGTTEPGSSGSPLFNEDRRVVGQDIDQKYRTDDPRQAPSDFGKETTYGKFSLSWDGGGTSDTRLKDWLDPINSGVTTLDGIKMPNLQFGWVFPNSSVTHYAAYTDMQIGSNSTSSYKVESGAVLSLKAGREIKISPCTQIKAGSEFHAYIENPDCDDIVPLSDKLTDHNPNICSTYPKLVKEDQDFNTAYTGSTMLKVSPNPVTSISDISLKVGSADNVSLMLYDNLGNQRYSYLDNISLKSGTYNYKLDGNDLNSGMFVLILKIDGIIVTEKVINLK